MALLSKRSNVLEESCLDSSQLVQGHMRCSGNPKVKIDRSLMLDVMREEANWALTTHIRYHCPMEDSSGIASTGFLQTIFLT